MLETYRNTMQQFEVGEETDGYKLGRVRDGLEWKCDGNT